MEHGSHSDDGNLYFAGSLYNDKGWTDNNLSQVRQLFGKLTRYIGGSDVAVSLLYADNLLFGNQTVPLSMLDRAAQGYSHPDYVGSQTFMLNTRATVELDTSNSVAGNASNSAAGTPVQAGNRIPGIPQWVFKGRFSYPITTQTRLGVSIQAQDSQYARGDENNADANGKVPGFGTVKLDVQHSIDPHLSVYAGVSNLLDRKYATHGTLANNNLATGAAEQFRSLGAPRTLYAGLQTKF